jgi:hypothetical protein
MPATVNLAPLAKLRFVDNNGVPLAGGKVFTYVAGQTTKQATYTDASGATLNPNPVILDSRGEAAIWFDQTLAYKVTLAPSTDTDPPTAPIWTVDNIPANNLNQLLSASGGSALIGFLPAGVGAVLTTVQQYLRDLNSKLNGVNVISVDMAPYNGNLSAALDAALAANASATVLVLGAADYNIVGKYKLPTAAGNGVGNQLKNLTIRGAGMPIKAADGTRFVSGSGTVIQGCLLNYADNFRAEGLGVDCGSYVVGTLNAGTYLDGFVPGTHQLQGVGTDYTTYIKSVSFDRIRVLMNTPVSGTAATYKHGALVEHIIGGRAGSIEVDGGYHGIAMKSVNFKIDSIWVYNQQFGDAYILKSDLYTLCSGVTIGVLSIGREDATLVPPAGLIESTAGGYNTQNVAIGILRGIKCSGLMAPTGAAAPKTNVSIGTVIGDQIAGDALYFDANCSRFTIGQHTITNTTGGGAGIRTATGCAQISIGSGSVTNAGGDGYALGGDVTHGKINAVTTGGYGVNRSAETVIVPDNISGSGNTSGLISSAYVALNSSAFVNSWVDAGGSPAVFQAILVGRTVTLRGTIKNGTAGLVGTLPAGIRPSATLSFITVAVTSGGTRTFGHVDVAADGTITVANFATLAVNCVVAFNFSFSL